MLRSELADDLFRVFGHLRAFEHVLDHTVLVDEKGRSLQAHEGLAVELLLAPHAVRLDDRVIGVGDQPVIAILGDYGFQYTVQELAVAVELELTLPIIIWDNGKLGEIEESMVRAQIAPNAVVQRNPDFCKLAEAYGAFAVAPSDLASFKEAVKDALARKGPSIIHVRSDIALNPV